MHNYKVEMSYMLFKDSAFLLLLQAIYIQYGDDESQLNKPCLTIPTKP